MNRLRVEFKFLSHMWKVSLSTAMQYKSSFYTQMFGMLLNDFIFLVYWLIFYQKFKIVGNYTLDDMLMQFSVVTAAFGLAFSLFGNTFSLSKTINQGALDYFLVLPRNTLIHIISSRFSIVALGDLLCGVIIFIVIGDLTLERIFMWIIMVTLSAIIFIMFNIIIGCLSFWLGNSEAISSIINEVLISFSTYPNNIFKGLAKFILITVIPSTFIGTVPVKIIMHHDTTLLFQLIIYTGVISLLAVFIFKRGLRRYESTSSINLKI